jgi:hypothetical protein
VDLAIQNDVDLMYTFGVTPTWASARPTEPFVYGAGGAAEPRSLSDWSDYVRTLATRYQGRILVWELWNEPKFSDTDRDYLKAFYTGTAASLGQLAMQASAILRGVDSRNQLLTPGFTGDGQRMVAFLERGGGATLRSAFDGVAWHLYSRTPEGLPQTIQYLRQQMARGGVAGKPLWNTEAGYYLDTARKLGWTEAVHTSDQMAAFVARSLILSAASGLERSYYYSLDGGPRGLIDLDTGAPNPAGIAYGRVYRWLVGSTIDGCEQQGAVTYVCRLTRGSRRAWVVWLTEGKGEVRLGSGESPPQYETLRGQTFTVSPGGAVPVEEAPVLVKSDLRPWVQ